MTQQERVAFALGLMKKWKFPAECVDLFKRVEKSYFLTDPYGSFFGNLSDDYMARKIPFKALDAEIKRVAAETGVHHYTLSEVFFLNCGADLQKLYQKVGFTDDMFDGAMLDFYCKLMECREWHGVWGNETCYCTWPDQFFELTRYPLGRFQYEKDSFRDADCYRFGDVTLRRGDPVAKFHIPSCGPFPRELRYESYRRAYDFFPELRQNGKLPIICHSWLLFPEHKVFLPETSNIRDFCGDFQILECGFDSVPTVPERVFGSRCNAAFDNLPRDTGLRRAYADWLAAGGDTGYGYGILIFDGEKIVNNERGE